MLFSLFLVYILTYPIFFPFYLIFIHKKNKITKKNYNEKKLPSVRIIIPAFNEEKIIEKKIKNTFSLNYKNKKITVINDNSEDNTLKKLKKLKKRFPNLKIINNKKRLGKAKILNDTIKNTKEKYIFITDANIFLEKNSLKKLILRALKGDFYLVYGNLYLKKSKYSSITDEEITYWARENIIKKLENPYNITSPVGGFYIIKNQNIPKLPKTCLIEDMFILLKTLSSGKKSSFEYTAKGFEYTTNSTLNEFIRKKRIIKGGFFITKFFLKEKLYKKLYFKDNLAIIINKILRWYYPLIYTITLILGFLNYTKNKIAKIFVKLNVFFLSAIFFEFSINSFKNYINNQKNIRVKYLKKPLYFFMLIFAGITAFFEKDKNVLWEKELR